MSRTATPTLTTSLEHRKNYGIPYGPMSSKDAKAFAKTGGKRSSALIVEIRGEGAYVGFAPTTGLVALWMGAENVKSVSVLVGKKA